MCHVLCQMEWWPGLACQFSSSSVRSPVNFATMYRTIAESERYCLTRSSLKSIAPILYMLSLGSSNALDGSGTQGTRRISKRPYSHDPIHLFSEHVGTEQRALEPAQ